MRQAAFDRAKKSNINTRFYFEHKRNEVLKASAELSEMYLSNRLSEARKAAESLYDDIMRVAYWITEAYIKERSEKFLDELINTQSEEAKDVLKLKNYIMAQRIPVYVMTDKFPIALQILEKLI